MEETSGYEIGLPEAASTYAAQIDGLLFMLHFVMVAMFLIWGVYFVYCLVKYKATDGGRGQYHVKGESASFIPDGLVLAFEIWLILAFGIPIWASVKQETPPPEDSLEVYMVAQQFAWNFHYPGADGTFGERKVELVSPANPVGLNDDDPAAADDFITVNNFYVPVDKPVILTMTSKDVIHDFQVTNFRNKQDVVPGLETNFWFEANKEGKFEIGCAQLCGLGHTQMIGNVFVQSQEEYAKWEAGKIEERKEELEAW